jgi:glutathione S-transferase
MILIGQYDSPFVRRVGIAMRLYGMAFEHKPWSTFGNGDLIAPYNPLRRVPTLVLDNGESLVESTVILDWLDEQAGEAKALIPVSGDARRRALKVCALATGMADKAVSLFYEKVLHKELASTFWAERCRTQIEGVLAVLEKDRATWPEWWFGARMGHPDIAVACALRFVNDAHPGTFEPSRWPLLTAHAKNCEALDVFKDISQVFIPPAA